MNTKNRKWVDVAFFENVSDAEKAESFLKSKGFEARTYNDRALQLFLFLCPPHATFRAQVRLQDFKVVKDLFERDAIAAEFVKNAIHCPSCDALQVQYPQMTRKFFLPTLMLHLGIIFRIIDHQAYCEHCHFLWSLPKKQSASPFKATEKTFHP